MLKIKIAQSRQKDVLVIISPLLSHEVFRGANEDASFLGPGHSSDRVEGLGNNYNRKLGAIC